MFYTKHTTVKSYYYYDQNCI